jgi:AraC-like DNA-binding protein
MSATENTNYLVERTDTATGAGGDATDLWAEHVCRNHGALRFRFADRAGFRGRTVVQQYDRRQLVDFWSDGISYGRTALDVRRDGDETLRLVLPIAGAFVARQGDRSVAIGPGAAAVLSKASPFHLAHEDAARALVLNLPAEPSPGVPVPRLVDVRSGVGAVAASMLSSVAAHREAVDGAQFRLVADTVAQLLGRATWDDAGRGIGATAAAGGTDAAATVADTLAAVDAAVREHVRLHAHDVALTPARIARDLGWSVRQIQLALARSGTTPSALVRDARLDRARRLLESAASRTVADVAYASGFRSLSVLTARFKERFGTTPGEYRRTHEHREPPTG